MFGRRLYGLEKRVNELQAANDTIREDYNKLKGKFNEIKRINSSLTALAADSEISKPDLVPGRVFIHMNEGVLHLRLLVHKNTVSDKYALLVLRGAKNEVNGPNKMGWVDSLDEVLDYMENNNYRLLRDQSLMGSILSYD